MTNNEKELMARIAGTIHGIRRAPLVGCSFQTSRLNAIRWQITTNKGLPSLSTDRTDRRTVEVLISQKLLIPSGSTKDRFHKLTTLGLFTAFSLIADTPSHLAMALKKIKERTEKKAVTFDKDVVAIPFHRTAGFPSCFAILEMLGLIEIGYHCTEMQEIKAYYAIRCTGAAFTFPSDKEYPSFDESITDAFSCGLNEGHELAKSQIPTEYKNECTLLPDFQIKSFKDSKTEKQFRDAKGIFSLEGF